jgi:hypothetical protein
MNHREQVEFDLSETLEDPDAWGLPVELRDPDGDIQTKTVVLAASDLSFAASDNSMNSTTTDLRDPLIDDGDELQFNGSVNNTGTYTVSSIAENKIVFEESITDESAGSEIKVLNLDRPLNGQVIYETLEQQTDTGADVIVHKPVVTLRRSSLIRIPLQTDKNQWYVSIPIKPSQSATKQPYIMDRPSEGGDSIGFIRLYLSKPVQSP